LNHGTSLQLVEKALGACRARSSLKAGEEFKRLNRHDRGRALTQNFVLLPKKIELKAAMMSNSLPAIRRSCEGGNTCTMPPGAFIALQQQSNHHEFCAIQPLPGLRLQNPRT